MRCEHERWAAFHCPDRLPLHSLHFDVGHTHCYLMTIFKLVFYNFDGIEIMRTCFHSQDRYREFLLKHFQSRSDCHLHQVHFLIMGESSNDKLFEKLLSTLIKCLSSSWGCVAVQLSLTKYIWRWLSAPFHCGKCGSSVHQWSSFDFIGTSLQMHWFHWLTANVTWRLVNHQRNRKLDMAYLCLMSL